jgi:hypothetical protein
MVAKPDITKTEPATNTAAELALPPVKRRPGRPRKHPLPLAEVTPDVVAAAIATAAAAIDSPVVAPEKSAEPADDRIGDEVDPRAEAIGFDDGRTYRCDGGVIVERLT